MEGHSLLHWCHGVLENYYHTLYRHCLRYVYSPLIEKALDDFRVRWNTHAIRPNRLAGCPSGVPDDLYHLPQLTGMLHSVVPIYYAGENARYSWHFSRYHSVQATSCSQQASFLQVTFSQKPFYGGRLYTSLLAIDRLFTLGCSYHLALLISCMCNFYLKLCS